MPDESKADEILRRAKASRKSSSRTMWIAALLIGAICAIGFVLLFTGTQESATPLPRAVEDHGLGFGAGVLVGAVVGIAIGYAIARQSSRNTP